MVHSQRAPGPGELLAVTPASVLLDIPADASLVATARLVVSCLAATRRELSLERLDDLKLAVSEACTNAINAYGPEAADPRVLVSWGEEDDHLEVVVTDHGPGYHPGQPPAGSSAGLGVRLIKILVDEAHWEPANPGTTVRMFLNCPRATPDRD